MHQLLRMHDFAAESLADALVTKADTENGDLAGEGVNQRHGNAGLVRRARPRRNHDMARRQFRYLFQRDLVVAKHAHVLPQFGQVLHQVVGERVVIVQHQEHK
ncbi:hypothetical protein GALL_370030 [mine drainage metagenome]|uniref:Uncharacterized protein n=1 Tax=mine drainage metagenome TaxID=410659 RepID=A0A1J5QC40_9ZZZZ